MNQGAPKTIDMPSSAEVSETEKQARKLGILKDQARKALLDAAACVRRADKSFREIDADHARISECLALRDAIALTLSRI